MQSRDIFSIFLNMKVYFVFSFESPPRGDSNQNTKYTIFNTKKKITLNYPKSAAMGFFPRDSRTSSKQPSVFEPLKCYCIIIIIIINGIFLNVFLLFLQMKTTMMTMYKRGKGRSFS